MSFFTLCVSFLEFMRFWLCQMLRGGNSIFRNGSTFYKTFSSSPRRWEILHEHIASSLHGLSCTRWKDRVASARPFAAHLPGIRSACKPSCQILKSYILIAKPKIILLHFLQVILMHTLSVGGWMATTPEGERIDELFSKLDLSQIISEPTNFEPHKKPSCIDLIVTKHSWKWSRASLDSYCHHQIIHCKANFIIPPPPPFERKIWHFNRANSVAIKRCMTSFPWRQHLNINTDPNWQVKTFTDILLNIISNFIPNEIKRFVPRDPPWVTKALKTMLDRKNRFFRSYKRHGYKIEDKTRLDAVRIECQQAVEFAKLACLTNLGNKVSDSNTSQKSYWEIINRVMNKCTAPKIPHLLVNNIFIPNCRGKAKYINYFFAQQCKSVINSRVLPTLSFLTNGRVDHISIGNDDIISLIRKINPNKATGPDGVSGQMLLLCDYSVILPLHIIFKNILSTSIYPDMWKLANVTPIFKKGDKQLINNYKPISLQPICGKIFEKLILNNLYNYLHLKGLIIKNQSGFRPGDSTTNQLLYFVDEIQ